MWNLAARLNKMKYELWLDKLRSLILVGLFQIKARYIRDKYQVLFNLTQDSWSVLAVVEEPETAFRGWIAALCRVVDIKTVTEYKESHLPSEMLTSEPSTFLSEV